MGTSDERECISGTIDDDHNSQNTQACSYDFKFIIHSTKLLNCCVFIATSVLHSITSIELYKLFVHLLLTIIICPVRPSARFHCKTIGKMPVWGLYALVQAGPEKAVRPCLEHNAIFQDFVAF